MLYLSRRFAKWVTNYHNPKSLGRKFRAKRVKLLLALIEEVF